MQPSQVTLAPEAHNVGAARRFVRQALHQLGAAGAADDAEMLASELATNAVIHARTPFTIEVSRNGASIRLCVHDLSPARPRLRHYGTDSTTGRGLRLVETFATSWGVERQAGGKTIWFELPVTGSGAQQAWDDATDVDALLAAFDDTDDTGPGKVRVLHRHEGRIRTAA